MKCRSYLVQWLSGKLSQRPPSTSFTAQSTYDRQMRMGLGTIPTYSLTEKQWVQRNHFRICSNFWMDKTPGQKAAWESAGDAKDITAYNAWQAYCVKQEYYNKIWKYTGRENRTYNIYGSRYLAGTWTNMGTYPPLYWTVTRINLRLHRVGNPKTLEVAIQEGTPYSDDWEDYPAHGQIPGSEITPIWLNADTTVELTMYDDASAKTSSFLMRVIGGDASNYVVAHNKDAWPLPHGAGKYYSLNAGQTWINDPTEWTPAGIYGVFKI